MVRVKHLWVFLRLSVLIKQKTVLFKKEGEGAKKGSAVEAVQVWTGKEFLDAEYCTQA